MSTYATPRAYQSALARAPKNIEAGQHCADVPDEAVVFLVGMRVNRWLRIWSWWPVFSAMPRMLRQIRKAPETGFLGARTYWSGRDFMVVQYWRSLEHLGAFARDPRFRHLTAWRDFNRKAAGTADVGIFHETYAVSANQVETLYGNMPRHGLGAAFGVVARNASARTKTGERLGGAETEHTAALK